MNPIILLSLSVCLLASCTLSEVQNTSQRTSQTQPVTGVTQNQETTITPIVTDPIVVSTILRDAYSEERLAEDVYTMMVAKYPQFTEVINIITSEEKHSEQVGRLLDARDIARPVDYGRYTSTYEVLKKMIDTSLTQAIEA